jgi:hypothetical protein
MACLPRPRGTVPVSFPMHYCEQKQQEVAIGRGRLKSVVTSVDIKIVTAR